MIVNVKRDDARQAMSVEVVFDANDVGCLLAFRPPGREPWLKFEGRKPSDVLRDLALWAALLEQRIEAPLVGPAVIAEGV